ncbi:spherical body protein, putative [Babesia ovis]|uniref:Spherical body protein, putative n=1 Tax=Babesia ovis TaxID=5869 RepID=A0A9W5TCK2_BABOV|nr:spherical body protein, putative [Babesia ovis]
MAGVAAGIKKYLFNGEVCLQATNEDTKCLVRDAIKMSVDMHSGLMHPLILKTIEANGHQRVIYSIAKLYSRHNRSVSNKIRTMYISYVISPLLNIDKFSGYSDSPPSSFNSYSSEIYLNIQERRFMVKLTLGAHANKNIIIKIPSYIDGVFKPENILNDQSNIVNLCADLPKHKDRFTEIDISSTDSNAAELVVLANLRRGCWLYTQYSMVPLYGPRYRFIKVVNKKAKQEIYQEGEQMYVTYVEVFDHVHQGWQYVVVNLRKLDGNNYTNDDYGDIKEVYKRIDDEGNIAYLDLRILCRWPYINMLYNIKIDDGSCHDNDIHDVMMDTAGEHEC